MARDMQVSGPTLAQPVWCGDPLGRDQLVPGGAKLDAAQFFPRDSVLVTVGGAGAAIGAVSIPVTALTGAIPAGTMLDFTGAGKFARTSAAVAAGAVAIPVEALPEALVAGDTARYAGTGKKVVVGGTVVGRTIAERDAGTGFGPAVNTDDEIHIVAWTVSDADHINDVELIRQNAGVLIKENFLPGWADLAANLKTAVRARFNCVRGRA